MKMQILHFADAHIGVETHGKLDSSTGLNTRILDFVRCLEFIVDTAIERQVDAVLFAGDAYDYAVPTPTYQKLFGAQIKRLSDAGIPVVLIVGNHDMPVSYGRVSPLELFNVLGVPYVYVAARPKVFKLMTRSGLLQVACLPYPNRSIYLTREESRSMSEEEITKRIEGICSDCISAMAKELSQDAPSVLLAHIAIMGATYSGSERVVTLGIEPSLMLSALAKPQFKYVALGHIHRHQDLNPHSLPHVVYSGSIERCDFAEENEPKGFCIVRIDDGEFEFIETPARRFVTIDVNLHSFRDPTQALINAISERNVRDAIVRIRYSCTDEQQATINWKAIEQALSEAFRVVSVVRQVEKQRSRPKAVITEQMDIIEALQRYIEHKDELKELKDELVKYTRQLEVELEKRRERSPTKNVSHL